MADADGRLRSRLSVWHGISIDDDPRDQPVTTILLVGAGAFVIAPPVIHIAHGNSRRALPSLASRILLPAAGALAFGGFVALNQSDDCSGMGGDSASDCENNKTTSRIVAGGIGAVGGMIAASWMDASWFAREPAARTTSIGLVPNVGRDRVGIAIGGAF